MAGDALTNACVHEWLTPLLEETRRTLHAPRLQFNSAALWWFLERLSAQERAEILGKYLKARAAGRKGRMARQRQRKAGSEGA
jgi:hypothetical protein